MDELKLIRSFLEDEKRVVYGFVLLQDYYQNINKWMEECEVDCYRSFGILKDLHESLFKAFDFVKMDWLCNEFDWAIFIKDALQVAYKCNPAKDSNEIYAEVNALLFLSGKIGEKISLKKYDEKIRWYNKIRDFEYLGIIGNEQKVDVSKCIFTFLESQLRYDKNNLIAKYFCDNVLKNLGNASEPFLLSFLFFYCYLYYLVYCEEEKVVNDIDANLRTRCVELIESTQEKFKSVLNSLIYRERVFCKDPYNQTNIFNKNIFSTFTSSLRRYEHFLEDEAKVLVMDECVDEFISFCLIYMRSLSIPGGVPLESFINENQLERLYLHFSSNDGINDSFNFFTKKFIGCDGLESFRELFFLKLTDCHKSKLLKECISMPEEHYDYIGQNIEQNLKDTFKECFDDGCETLEEVTLLSNSSIPQNMKIDRVLSSHDDILVLNLLISLFNKMRKTESAEIMNVSRITDEEILEYVEKHKGFVYVGSKSLLQPYNICNHYKRYNDAIQNLKGVHNCGWQIGMFIDPNNFKICIRNVKVQRRPKMIDDVNVVEENGIYKYSPSLGDVLSFTKEELEYYLKSHESILCITAKVGFKLQTNQKIDFLLRGNSGNKTDEIYYKKNH